MIRDFESWNATLGEESRLDDLKGSRVGIDAAYYLETRMLGEGHGEPLIPALGGLPLGLRKFLEDDMERFAKHGIELLFVFDGLDLARQDDPFRRRREGAELNAAAWALYDTHQAEESVAKFWTSTYVTAQDFFPAMQAFLVETKVPFFVAPYSAWAQLVYLLKTNKIQAISGPSELFLFECDKVISQWKFDDASFEWLSRARCVADAKKTVGNGDISEDVFVDACMLAGNHFLPTLPILDSPQRKEALKPLSAMNMIVNNGNGRNGYSVVLNHQEDPRIKRLEYVDKYRRARLAVKYHPIMTSESTVKPLLAHELSGDAHEYIGQRLPDELWHYFSRGLINARVLNWCATREINEPPPVDGGDSSEYQTLVSSKLTPLRLTTQKLLASSLQFYYQNKAISLRCWFSGETHFHDLKNWPDTHPAVDKWAVKESVFGDAVAKVQPSGFLGAAVLALTDPDFATKTITSKNINDPLVTKDEIIYNSIWRFLTLREYIDIKTHILTPLGKMLAAVMSSLKGNPKHEEAALLAVELLRLGVLSSRSMFRYNGAPMRGTENDKENNLLISRIAGLGTLHHRPIGFTGPLSQHLLGYNSIINAVRATLRDMVEVSATQLLLAGFAKRDINIAEIAPELPLLRSLDCALSIAVKSYLDEITQYPAENPDPTSPASKKSVREMLSQRYFPQSDNIDADLTTAFGLWDALAEGVQVAPASLMSDKEKKRWQETNEWLAARR